MLDFEKKMNANDLLAEYFVQPLKDNPRMLKQDGTFVIFGLGTEKNTTTKHSVQSSAFKEILISNKEEILNDLEELGINKTTLFPEVEGVAEYLKSSIRMKDEQSFY